MKIEEYSPEPSMDEILASIRQIISNEEEEEKKKELAAKRQPLTKQAEDILDLTDLLPEENNEKKLTQRKALYPRKEMPKPSRPAPGKEALKEADSILPLESPWEESNISETALSELKAALQSTSSEKPPTDSSLQNTHHKTIENLVTELLRPMIKEWLDQNMPSLVQWTINEQMEKVVQQLKSSSPSSRKVGKASLFAHQKK